MARTLTWLLVVAGLAGAAVFGHFALVDWKALRFAYAVFESASRGGGDLRAVYVAGTTQGIYRINLFADGTWVLLCLILAAIGLHGLLGNNRRAPKGDTR